MARQGNYVQVSNTGNWAAPLTSALGGLSKKYTGLDAEERENTRLADRNRILDDRADRDYRLRQKGQTDSNAIAEKNLSFKEAEANYAEARRAAKKEISQFTNDPKNTNLPFELANYSTEQQDEFNNATRGIEQERDLTRDLLTNVANGESVPEDFEKALGIYKARVGSNVKNKGEVNALVSERGSRLESLLAQLGSIEDPAKKNEIITSAIDGLYKPQLSRIQNIIASGDALTKREKGKAYSSRLSDKTRETLTLDEIGTLVGSMNTADSREMLLATEAARVASENQASKDNIAGVKSYFTALGGNSKSKGSFNRSSASIASAIDQISKLEIGRFDTDKAKTALTNMLEDGEIDPKIAASVIAFSIDKGLLDNSIDGVGTEGFTEMKEMARTLSNPKGYTGKGKRPVPTLEQFQYTAASPKSITDLMRSRVTGLNDFSGRLAIDSEFDVRRPSASPVPVTSEAEQQVLSTDVLTPTVVTSPIPEVTPAEAEKNQRIESYKESADMTKEVNKKFAGVFGKPIDSETVLVLPYDKEGNSKPWKVVWDEINSNSALPFLDSISKEEGDAAANDPAKQKELIDKANLLIGEQLKFMASQGEATQDTVDVVGRLFRETGNDIQDFFSSYSPIRAEERIVANKPRLEEYKENDELRNRLANFVNKQTGNDARDEDNYDRMINSFNNTRNASPTVDTAADTLEALSTVTGTGLLAKGTIKSIPMAKNVIQKVRGWFSKSGPKEIKTKNGGAQRTTGKDRTTVVSRDKATDKRMNEPALWRRERSRLDEALKGRN